MANQPIHTYNFGMNGIHGSVYYRSKRAADLVNTPRFLRYPNQPLYIPIGHGCLDTICSSSDSPEARELYSCFQPLTTEEIQFKEDNAWKRSYVEQGYSFIFPVHLPDPAVDRQRIKAFLDQRGVSVELLVDRPAAVPVEPAKPEDPVPVEPAKPEDPVPVAEPVTQPEPVAPAKPADPVPAKPADPVPQPVTRSVTRPPPHRFSVMVPSTLMGGMHVYRPFTPAERRQHEMHMAAALAYITRIRQPFPPQKRARK
jgi:hypothetical protein